MSERSRALTIILALAVPAPGCGSDPLTGPSDIPVTFSGRVVDYRTQSPAAAVVVRLGPLVESDFSPSEATTNGYGRYVVTVPRTTTFTVSVDGVFAGTARINGRAYRGDLFIRGGTCIARYGIVIDSRSLQPIQGAMLTLTGMTTTSGADGWYRIDLGCPDVVLPGGTTFINVSHPDYQARTQVVGRGVAGVSRLDLDLERR